MFTIYSDNDPGSTLVSNLFIDEYMKSANDAQIKIYLYLLRIMGTRRPVSVSDLADQFNHTEKDVVRSLHYWEKKGLLDLAFDKEENLTSIRLRKPSPAAERHVLPFAPTGRRIDEAGPGQVTGLVNTDGSLRMAAGENYPSSPFSSLQNSRVQDFSVLTAEEGAEQAGSPAPAGNGAEPASVSSPVPDVSARQSSAASSDREDLSELEALNTFRNNPDRAQLLFVIEQYIGKPLSLNEIRIIYNISEKLHFSDELLDHLLQYCVDRGKKDFRYIRKVAENWASQGIMTPSQAEAAASKESAAPARRSPKKDSPAKEKSSEKSCRRPRSSNSFNQFEQNSYDFDSLEEELLQS